MTWLPSQPTPLVGRTAELSTLRDKLRVGGERLLTLTGPAGIGKTRLAIELAKNVRDAFADGVVLVDLSAVAEPGSVAPTIAHELGLRDSPGRPALDRVRARLGD